MFIVFRGLFSGNQKNLITDRKLRPHKPSKLSITIRISCHFPIILLGRVLAVPGLNLDLLCIRQLDGVPFCENYAKLYFDACKTLRKKGLNSGW